MRLEDWTSIWTNLGLTPADGFLLIIFLGGWIFLAKDLKIGLVYYLLMYGLAFTAYALFNLNTAKVLIAVFVSVLLMAISLYSSHQKTVIS